MTELQTSDATPLAMSPEPKAGRGWLGAPRQKDRVILLDAARGLGVLGILPCNMPDFAMPMDVSESVMSWPLGHGPGTIAGWAMTQIFFQRRFVTLFSMMFGVSLFLVGGERSDAERGLILRKRLFALLGIGLFHCFAVWWGDVLITYALAGFIMLFLRSRPAASLMRIGLIVFGVFTLLQTGAAIGMTIQANAHPPTPDQAAKIAKKAAESIAEYRSGFMGSLIGNAKNGLTAQMGQVFIVPWAFSLMCIGLAAYKWGVFTGEASRTTYRWLAGAGLLALLATAVGFGVSIASNFANGTRGMAGWVQIVFAPINSLGYVAGLYFALNIGALRFFPKALAPVGQMAFTNYLTQSLMMTAVFYGGRGLNLYGEVDRPMQWAIVIGVWALQIVWSPIWLHYCTMGPLEWGWRRLYRGNAPLLRPRPGTPAPSAPAM